jgi:hypothetical protein
VVLRWAANTGRKGRSLEAKRDLGDVAMSLVDVSRYGGAGSRV